jgi:ribose/xylose/arabinose/galactoside ABC-type transport system permease subunit
LGTMAFVILKENIGLSVSMFLLLIHMLPVYIFRKDRIDIVGSLLFFGTYLLYLRLNGTDIQQVYNRILSEPMPTIGSYISSRLGI